MTNVSFHMVLGEFLTDYLGCKSFMHCESEINILNKAG